MKWIQLPVSMANSTPNMPIVFTVNQQLYLLTHEEKHCFLFSVKDCHTQTRFIKGLDLNVKETEGFQVIISSEPSSFELYDNKQRILVNLELSLLTKKVVPQKTNVFNFYHLDRLYGIENEVKDSLVTIRRWDDGEMEGNPVRVQKLLDCDAFSGNEICTSPIAFESGVLFVVRKSDPKKKLSLHQLVWMDQDFKISKRSSHFYLQKRSHERIVSLCWYENKLLFGCTALDKEKGFLASLSMVPLRP